MTFKERRSFAQLGGFYRPSCRSLIHVTSTQGEDSYNGALLSISFKALHAWVARLGGTIDLVWWLSTSLEQCINWQRFHNGNTAHRDSRSPSINLPTLNFIYLFCNIPFWKVMSRALTKFWNEFKKKIKVEKTSKAFISVDSGAAAL